MNSFRLTQNQIGKNLYLFPIGDGCNTGLTPFPNTGESNYEDVDDTRLNPDEDTSYVQNNTAAVLYDLYDGSNHTTETGVINYMQVFARAKSNLIAPHPDATFKIIIDDSNCTDTQKSDSFNLVTGYSNYNKIWNTNPYTSVAFTWDDIDAYQFGIECDSPTITGASCSLTLRPNAVGSRNQCTPNGAVTNWECVDEATPDEDTTYNSANTAAGKYDSFNTPDHTTETGTIVKVTVFIRSRRIGGSNGLSGHTIYITTDAGVSYQNGPGQVVPTSYSNHSYTWATNPRTAAAWTWADIDALEIGYQIYSFDSEIRCTQCYAIVEYTEDVNPDIRTTQCYAKVNYDETVHCDLNMPEEVSQNYAQNIKTLNHWSGNRSVYGLARNKDTTVMLGYEIEDSVCTDACARLKCVEELGKQGDPVSLTGLGYSDYDDEYQILSWGWKCISKKPVYYEWILELERTT